MFFNQIDGRSNALVPSVTAYAFASCSFAQMGQNNSQSRDNYVYIYAPDGPFPHQLNLARVPKDKILDRASYTFFTSLRADGNAEWSTDIFKHGAVHTFPERTGADYFGWYSWLPSVVWNEGLGLFIMCTGGTYAKSMAAEEFYNGWMHDKSGSLGFYWAQNPWGPWHEFFYDPYWIADSEANRTYQPKLSPKWMSDNGREMVLVWSDQQAEQANYRWNQMHITLVVENARK
jgi:hypothetical protein